MEYLLPETLISNKGKATKRKKRQKIPTLSGVNRPKYSDEFVSNTLWLCKFKPIRLVAELLGISENLVYMWKVGQIRVHIKPVPPMHINLETQ